MISLCPFSPLCRSGQKTRIFSQKIGGLFWVQRMGYILEHIDTFYENDFIKDTLVFKG